MFLLNNFVMLLQQSFWESLRQGIFTMVTLKQSTSSPDQKTSRIAVETSWSTTQSDSIVSQTNKRSSFLSYNTMNRQHIFSDIP